MSGSLLRSPEREVCPPLIVVTADEKTPELLRATANLQNVLLVGATYLSVYHILNADHIVLSAKSVPTIKNWLLKEGA